MTTDRIDGTRCDSTIDHTTGITASRPGFGSEADTTSETTVSAPASGLETDRNIDITDIVAAFGCVIAADRRP
jgi:hypothetical protein